MVIGVAANGIDQNKMTPKIDVKMMLCWIVSLFRFKTNSNKKSECYFS